MSNFRGRGTPTRRGGAGAWGGRPSAPKGTFRDGVWHCDCNPPLPAVHFQVKKEGPTKGRWFRSCQKQQNDNNRCKFFLWDSDAHPREAAALANNSRTESGVQTTITTPRAQRVASPPPPYTPEAEPSGGTKRNRATLQAEEDKFGLSDGNDDFEDELDQVMVAAETPSKRPRTEGFATPSGPPRRRLPWQTDATPTSNALPTPQTEPRTVSKDLFPTRFSAPGDSIPTPARYLSSDDSQTITPSSSPNATPTPARFKDVPESDLVRDVFGVLREANAQLDEQTRKNLTSVLSRHATIAEGVKRGREVARAAVTAKTAKVTELIYRVTTLEAELEAEKAKVGHLQWNLEHGQQSD